MAVQSNHNQPEFTVIKEWLGLGCAAFCTGQSANSTEGFVSFTQSLLCLIKRPRWSLKILPVDMHSFTTLEHGLHLLPVCRPRLPVCPLRWRLGDHDPHSPSLSSPCSTVRDCHHIKLVIVVLDFNPSAQRQRQIQVTQKDFVSEENKTQAVIV